MAGLHALQRWLCKPAEAEDSVRVCSRVGRPRLDTAGDACIRSGTTAQAAC